jgi:hypothetical protein
MRRADSPRVADDRGLRPRDFWGAKPPALMGVRTGDSGVKNPVARWLWYGVEPATDFVRQNANL